MVGALLLLQVAEKEVIGIAHHPHPQSGLDIQVGTVLFGVLIERCPGSRRGMCEPVLKEYLWTKTQVSSLQLADHLGFRLCPSDWSVLGTQ